MSNVPEVVMCFHLDGIVQKYELIKTEDLPNLTNSEFSPTLVRDIARNILAFLKNNTTKEGHTYWLFKGNYLFFDNKLIFFVFYKWLQKTNMPSFFIQ